MKNRICFLFLILVLLITVSANAVYSQQLSREEERIIQSIDTFLELVAKENQAGAIGELLQHARGIALFPKLTKIGLGIGVQFGEGLVLRKDHQTQKWYGPAFVEMKTASVGPQIGIQDVSLLLIIMDEAAMDAFKKTDFEIGANISISPGPTEETLQKRADFNDSIYTYSYSEGLYAGFTLEGSVIHADSSANKSFYGASLSNEEILNNQEPMNKSALKLVLEIEKVS